MSVIMWVMVVVHREGIEDPLKHALTIVANDKKIKRLSLKRWIETFVGQGENPVMSWGNRSELKNKGRKKARSHMKTPTAPKHNMEPTVREHRKLLEETALKLVELEIPFMSSVAARCPPAARQVCSASHRQAQCKGSAKRE